MKDACGAHHKTQITLMPAEMKRQRLERQNASQDKKLAGHRNRSFIMREECVRQIPSRLSSSQRLLYVRVGRRTSVDMYVRCGLDCVRAYGRV